jgi:hypothetical protein
MRIERAGITFEISFRPAVRGTWNDPPESAEIEVREWNVSDWDALVEYVRTCGRGNGRVFQNVQTIVDDIMDNNYGDMLHEAEDYASDCECDARISAAEDAEYYPDLD